MPFTRRDKRAKRDKGKGRALPSDDLEDESTSGAQHEPPAISPKSLGRSGGDELCAISSALFHKAAAANKSSQAYCGSRDASADSNLASRLPMSRISLQPPEAGPVDWLTKVPSPIFDTSSIATADDEYRNGEIWRERRYSVISQNDPLAKTPPPVESKDQVPRDSAISARPPMHATMSHIEKIQSHGANSPDQEAAKPKRRDSILGPVRKLSTTLKRTWLKRWSLSSLSSSTTKTSPETTAPEKRRFTLGSLPFSTKSSAPLTSSAAARAELARIVSSSTPSSAPELPPFPRRLRVINDSDNNNDAENKDNASNMVNFDFGEGTFMELESVMVLHGNGEVLTLDEADLDQLERFKIQPEAKTWLRYQDALRPRDTVVVANSTPDVEGTTIILLISLIQN